ncbi:hypothetical protein AX16_002376 [Volvariella volvacea WC 439]|nr:hypothetical protein AX16_002376 [Volvariella volvacea WC 439]
MPNLLSIPPKRTYSVDVKEAARTYLADVAGVHPDEFKQDILEWNTLRRNAIGETVHSNRIQPALTYHAQLVSILQKLPSDIQLEFAYAPVFASDAIPITLRSLAFERTSVLFNLASLYSQLASLEDRSNKDGIRRALNYYQSAAGTFVHLISDALQKLVHGSDDGEVPLDLTKGFVESMELLMLAQAQECTWQAAKIDHYKNGIIARIAVRTAQLYGLAWNAIVDATPRVKQLLPSDWLPHIEAKENHFEAVAQYRKSLDDIEGHRYGHEISRLQQAQLKAKKAYDVARKGRIAPAVIADIQSLLETVQKSLARAERDNDLIYHQDVPALSTLPTISPAELAKPVVPPGLLDLSSQLGSHTPLFSRLLGWGAREAISIYNERKRDIVQNRIVGAAQEIKDADGRTLHELSLPASLEALERPVGLPPSLLAKAEEVRLEDGPARIEASLEDVQKLAQRDQAILNEAMDILDSEASEDEEARKNMDIARLPSYQANTELVEKDRRYRDILARAADADEVVRRKWDEWEPNITELTWSEEELEASIPSSTTLPGDPAPAQASQTQVHARSLRSLLDTIQDFHKSLDDIIDRAKLTEEVDDIHDRILRVADGYEKLAEVHPALFEDIMDEELSKYDKFIKEIDDIQQRRENTISEVRKHNELFLRSRRDDPTVKEREHALQSLDLAYHKYREIVRNLDEGFKFYNDLAGILLQFKEACKAWSHQRKQELHGLSRLNQTMGSLSIRDDEEDALPPQRPRQDIASPPPPAQNTTPTTPVPPNPQNHSTPSAVVIGSGPSPLLGKTRKPTAGKSALGLPSINSSDWEFEDIQLPPAPSGSRTPSGKTVRGSKTRR